MYLNIVYTKDKYSIIKSDRYTIIESRSGLRIANFNSLDTAISWVDRFIEKGSYY